MRALVGVALATAAVMAALLSAGSADPAHGARDGRQPNIVFIYSDDQNLSEFRRRFMPRTKRLLAQKGTEFQDFVVSTPLCCPSRVTYLTGQYPHNSNVFSNKRGYTEMEHKRSTLPAWLGVAGYRTGFFGKFLQGYDDENRIEDPAPGWDEWAVTLEPRYYDYVMGMDGKKRSYGGRPRDYHTSVVTRKAVRFVRSNARERKPLFMTVNYLAPHAGKNSPRPCAGTAAPAPGDERLYEDEPMPTPPSFNETDVSDKPRFVRERKQFGRRTIEKLERRFRCRVASLRDLDRGIASLVEAFGRVKELRNTVFVFTSDNGVQMGEHRLKGKNFAYEEGIHMPLVIRAPARYLGGEPLQDVPQLAGNVDLAPTILDLAGGAPPCLKREQRCVRLDGRSLVPLMRGDSSRYPEDRTILIESGKGGELCRFRGLRTSDELYVEHESLRNADGECAQAPEDESELYDLSDDPFELDNLLATDPVGSVGRQAELKSRLEALKHCKGSGCRRAEKGR